MGTQTDLFDQFDRAKARMEARFKLGEQQEQQLFDVVTKTVIVDKLVPPRAMGFFTDDQGKLRIVYNPTGTAPGVHCTVHRHALSQLCEGLTPPIPAKFASALSTSDRARVDLLAYNLEALFHGSEWAECGGQPKRFLHRIVGTELRGFLSRRFNRHLASAPLLRAFVDQCKLEGAKPVEATTSPVRNALKCLLPKVYEVFPGEYISVGAEWSNSDFGKGRLKVCQTIWRASTGTAAVIDESTGGRHVGSVIEDGDIEMSDETAQKEVAAQQSAVRDYVKSYFSEKTIERLLIALRAAHDQQIPWSTLASRLRSILGKSDLEWLKNALDKGTDIIDLPSVSFTPDGTRVPNAYWAASALGAVAAKSEDEERRMDLQREAGKLLAAAMGTA